MYVNNLRYTKVFISYGERLVIVKQINFEFLLEIYFWALLNPKSGFQKMSMCPWPALAPTPLNLHSHQTYILGEQHTV